MRILILPARSILLPLATASAFLSNPLGRSTFVPKSAGIFGSTGTAVVVGATGGLAAVLLNRQRKIGVYTPPPQRLIGTNIVITGATSGLGLESARRLASAGANLILTARTNDKGEQAVAAVEKHLHEIGVQYENQSINYKLLDLDRLSSVKDATAWDDVTRIDCLLNNAGIMALPNRELTSDGFEKQIQSNHLGHFALTAILSPKFSENCRIITVSSSAHTAANKGLLFDYMWKAENGYSAWKSYGQSKLANILFTQELQRRIDANGTLAWTAATLHPGVVATDLGRYMMGGDSQNNSMMKGFWQLLLAQAATLVLKTPEQGATTQIWLAAGAEGADIRGKYFYDCRARVLDEFAMSKAAAERLWKESEELTGVTFPVSVEAVREVIV